MFNIYIYYKNPKIAQSLKKICTSFFINFNYNTEIMCVNSINGLEEITDSNVSVYILESTDYLETISSMIYKKNILNYIILIVENSLQLVNIIKPNIRPSGVILKPIQKEILNDTLKEISLDLKSLTQKNIKEVFNFKCKNTEYVIPIDDILFFESKNKKVYINTISQEFNYYATLNTLMDNLPKYFMRVHKGFIVNTNTISSVDYNQNLITLNNSFIIPLSRTYKPEFKENMKGKSFL